MKIIKKTKSERYKKWCEKNKEHRKEYMKKYRSTEKYRLMKQKHDKKYYDNNKKIAQPRNEKQRFLASCRGYAATHIKKDKCYLCGSNGRLELHHSKGYKSKSIDGVIVVCTKCHRQVIHGRGTRIDGTNIKDYSRYEGETSVMGREECNS